MNSYEAALLKLECLKIAKEKTASIEDAVKMAKELYAYITGTV